MITEGSYVIGTKGIDEYDLDEVTDEMLAADMNLDLDTSKYCEGQLNMYTRFSSPCYLTQGILSSKVSIAL